MHPRPSHNQASPQTFILVKLVFTIEQIDFGQVHWNSLKINGVLYTNWVLYTIFLKTYIVYVLFWRDMRKNW